MFFGNGRPRRRFAWQPAWAAGLLTLAVIAGCAPPTAPGGQTSGQAPAAAARIQRTLVIAAGVPVDNMTNFGTRDAEVSSLVNAGMVIKDLNTFEWQGWLAAELPSLDRGTLRINPDGTAVSTWRMRPGVTWQDGTPFDTRDWVLGWEIAADPQVPVRERAVAEVIERMETPDSQTLIVHYKRIHPAARVLLRSYIVPIPRHIIEPVYRAGDYQAFEVHPYWSTQFIGTGAYRVVDMRPGEVMEMAAYDNYFLGRPKIDRVTWRIITDPQVMLTNVLTDNVHLTLRSAVTVEGAFTARDQWESTGGGRVILAPTNFMAADPSPQNAWFADVRLRQALMHSMDREEIRETLSRGQIDVTHIPLFPQHPAYPRALASATKFEYSPQRAEALFQQAGWTRGGDGILANQRGERLALEFQAKTGTDEEGLQQAVIGTWRRAGVDITSNNMPSRTMDLEENRGRWPGVRINSGTHDPDDWENYYHSSVIATEANRWIGRNRSGWTAPDKDKVLEDLFAAIVYQPERYDDLVVNFSQLYTRDLPQLPIRYNVEPMTIRRGLLGPLPKYGGPGENSRTWNAHLWEWTE